MCFSSALDDAQVDKSPVSIRAFGAQSKFSSELSSRIDRYSKTSVNFWNLNRWVAVRIDILGSLFSAALATYLVYVKKTSASETGFLINMAVTFTSALLVTVGRPPPLNLFFLTSSAHRFELSTTGRSKVFVQFSLIMSCHADSQVQPIGIIPQLGSLCGSHKSTSLERLYSYIHIDHEEPATESGKPPAYWPGSGDLKVEHLSAKYSEDGPTVLHDISFHIKSGERVGIGKLFYTLEMPIFNWELPVGRTGSGKVGLILQCSDVAEVVYYRAP